MNRYLPYLLAGAGGLLALVLTAPRTASGQLLPAPTPGEKARIGDDVFVRATLPTLAGTPGLQNAAFAVVRVEVSEPDAVFGRVRALLVPEAGTATLVSQPIQGPAAAIRRNEIVRVERGGEAA